MGDYQNNNNYRIISGLYTGTESVVKSSGITSIFFSVNSPVSQGCVIALTPFNDDGIDRAVDTETMRLMAS